MQNVVKRPAVREVHMPGNVDPRSLPPEKYERFETSGLSYDIKAGAQSVSISLD